MPFSILFFTLIIRSIVILVSEENYKKRHRDRGRVKKCETRRSIVSSLRLVRLHFSFLRLEPSGFSFSIPGTAQVSDRFLWDRGRSVESKGNTFIREKMTEGTRPLHVPILIRSRTIPEKSTEIADPQDYNQIR